MNNRDTLYLSVHLGAKVLRKPDSDSYQEGDLASNSRCLDLAKQPSSPARYVTSDLFLLHDYCWTLLFQIYNIKTSEDYIAGSDSRWEHEKWPIQPCYRSQMPAIETVLLFNKFHQQSDHHDPKIQKVALVKSTQSGPRNLPLNKRVPASLSSLSLAESLMADSNSEAWPDIKPARLPS